MLVKLLPLIEAESAAAVPAVKVMNAHEPVLVLPGFLYLIPLMVLFSIKCVVAEVEPVTLIPRLPELVLANG